jgi:hypothetical protein
MDNKIKTVCYDRLARKHYEKDHFLVEWSVTEQSAYGYWPSDFAG